MTLFAKTARRVYCGCIGAATIGLAGCETSSHRSVRTYEYSNEPPRARQTDPDPDPAPDRPSEGDWEMVSPGEMASPGQMVVDPE